jgi:two-component system alkaline phosphatase synthesis response regulator PhoP
MVSDVNILLTEDDKFISNALRVKLEKEGFNVSLTENGEEALTKLSENVYDLMLLDIVMPVKDGFETLETIRGNKIYDKLPVVMLSNLGQNSDVEKATKLGSNGFIVKSDTSLNDIVEKIKEIITAHAKQ